MTDQERIAYRFLVHDWEKTIKPLLNQNSIPYESGIRFNVDVFHKPEKKKVYLVEDDLDILFALNMMLEDAGYDVLLSHSARPLMERELPKLTSSFSTNDVGWRWFGNLSASTHAHRHKEHTGHHDHRCA